jgi:hypothetical protein
MSYQSEREFLQRCQDAGWSFSGRADGNFPSVAGTHEWKTALDEARDWASHNRPAMDQPEVKKPLTKDAERLFRFFYDNLFASIRYVHHQGYGAEARELLDAGLIREVGDTYIIQPKAETDLEKKTS